MKKLIFVFLVNAIFFVVFNLGHLAAAHINGLYSSEGFTDSGIYFFALGILFLSFVGCLVLEKATKVGFWKTASYVAFVAILATLSTLVSCSPLFDRIAPFWFNALFSLLYTAIIGAPDILCLLKRSKG